MKDKLYVNLGCGSRYHSDWINFDIVSGSPQVIGHDLRRGIPLADNSCDVAYHSHMIEHLRPAEAINLMEECFRILKPGGVVRVALPDLERICRCYLEKLESAVNNDETASDDYDWMMLELYDQTVREQPGGAMRGFLKRTPLPNASFIYERIGEEARAIIDPPVTVTDAKSKTLRRFSNSLHYRFGRLLEGFSKIILRLKGGDQSRALEIGTFRLAGEVHQWMYDRYSLARLMTDVGFQKPTQRSATDSAIPGWASFNLDTLLDGTVVKPDSLFMEATKPGG